jgi:hypothetical protein
MEAEDHPVAIESTTHSDNVSAEKKRKNWMTKSKTVSTIVYKSKEGLTTPSSPRPFSPYTPGQFSFDQKVMSPIQTPVGGVNTVGALQKQNSKDIELNQNITGTGVTRVVHAGQTSDPYFNLRKNQAFLADMHTWSLTNATSLPYMVDGRDRKKSK